jgi:uncharacterized protein (DUF885 family)
MLKRIVLTLLAAGTAACLNQGPPPDEVISGYVRAWADFYPTAAYAAGRKDSAARFERITEESAADWIRTNRAALSDLARAIPEASPEERIDLGLLERRIESELETWETEPAHRTSPALYAGLVSQALTHVLVGSDLSPRERAEAVRARLAGIRELCAAARRLLEDGRPIGTARAADVLDAAAGFLGDNLPGIVAGWPDPPDAGIFASGCRETAAAVRGLADFLRGDFASRLFLPDSLGRESYARRLRVFTGRDITPEEMVDLAMEEIRGVRAEMAALSRRYLAASGRGEAAATDEAAVLQALTVMESHRVGSRLELLDLFTGLVDRAESFLKEKNIAALPGRRTLKTDLSPAHFAGAAVGGVYAAGPFNPEADTLFYLPSVPDDAPLAAREAFYRSFNNHFNTIIVPHEIYPGHYMQLKLAAAQPRVVRALFADGLYVEGWGSLSEEIALDAGWNGFDPLDRLAHLRKRLENAVRAFISAKVHAAGWDRERVIRFAVEEGWLAPQFAVNLWDRVMDDPLQLTSYFLGFRSFRALLEAERERLGDGFSLRRFCDTVLEAGAVPIDALPALLEAL